MDLFGSDCVFWSLSVALPLGLVDLQVCLFAAITLGAFFLWEAGCLLGGLEVAGMVDRGRGKVTGSRHGSQLNVYLFQAPNVFLSSSSSSLSIMMQQAKLFFHCEMAAHNQKDSCTVWAANNTPLRDPDPAGSPARRTETDLGSDGSPHGDTWTRAGGNAHIRGRQGGGDGNM